MPFTPEFRTGFELYIDLNDNWQNLDEMQKTALLNYASARFEQSQEIGKMWGYDRASNRFFGQSSAVKATAETEMEAIRAAHLVDDFEIFREVIKIADLMAIAVNTAPLIEGNPNRSN